VSVSTEMALDRAALVKPESAGCFC